MSAQSERQAFSARLRAALKYRGHPTYTAAVVRLYNEVSNDRSLTVAAVRKWLVGEAILSQAKLQTLAAILHVAPEWLRFGTGAMVSVTCPSQLNDGERELLDSYRALETTHRTALLTYLRRHGLPASREL